MSAIIVTGKKYSDGALALKKALKKKGITTLKGPYQDFEWNAYISSPLSGSGIEIKKNTLIINWGDTHSFGSLSSYVNKMKKNNNHLLNGAIHSYSDKRAFFNMMAALPAGYMLAGACPSHWTDAESAKNWLFGANEDAKLCVRYKTASSGSNGLEIITADDVEENGMPTAPLYTQYIPKKSEFRAHIFRDRPTIWQQKKLKSGTENPNYLIRNHQYGWVFARENIQIPFVVETLINNFRNMFHSYWKLDFAAVDIIYNAYYNRAYILEINTAPGIEGQTVDDYCDFIVDMHTKTVVNYGASLAQMAAGQAVPNPIDWANINIPDTDSTPSPAN